MREEIEGEHSTLVPAFLFEEVGESDGGVHIRPAQQAREEDGHQQSPCGLCVDFIDRDGALVAVGEDEDCCELEAEELFGGCHVHDAELVVVEPAQGALL